MRATTKRPVIIWTPSGEIWFQEDVDDVLRLSFLGWTRDRNALKEFCATHNIDFVIHNPKNVSDATA